MIVNHKYLKQLKDKMLCNTPMIYIYSQEYVRLQESVIQASESIGILESSENLISWSLNKGFTTVTTSSSQYAEHDIFDLVDIIENLETKTIFILRNIDRLFQEDIRSIATIADCIELIYRGKPAILIASCSSLIIPDEIEKQVEFLKMPLPDMGEIKSIVTKKFDETGYKIDEATIDLFTKTLSGLTAREIESLAHQLLLNAIKEKRVLGQKDLDLIIDRKKDVVQKSGVIDLVTSTINFHDVGGLYNLKNWLKDRKKIFDDPITAQKNGIVEPRGILMFGVPGAGKSLTCKMVASYYNIPLLRFDLGMIFGQASPENAMLRALSLTESIAPCVLWLDEVEKAFAGSGLGAGKSSSSEINRVFGQLLTWMQERTTPVFMAVTSNNISQLEPTLYRDGRISERFFLGFIKSVPVLKGILEVHFKMRLKDKYKEIVKDIDYELVFKKMQQMIERYRGEEYAGYSGANIEALVEKSLEFRYFRDRKYIETKDLLMMLEYVKPQHGILIKEMIDKALEMDSIEA
jgi:SpoVK/Ycf46/Vps4 family AAA+-type ATPase